VWVLDAPHAVSSRDLIWIWESEGEKRKINSRALNRAPEGIMQGAKKASGREWIDMTPATKDLVLHSWPSYCH